MEKFPSEVLEKILEKSSPQEIVTVCSTNKNLNRICKDKRFDNFWRKKSKETYGASDSELEETIGAIQFDKFKSLYIIVHAPLWQYKVFIDYELLDNDIFISRAALIAALINNFSSITQDQIPYSEIFPLVDGEDHLLFNNCEIIIEEVNIGNFIYKEKLEQFQELRKYFTPEQLNIIYDLIDRKFENDSYKIKAYEKYFTSEEVGIIRKILNF
jgi:hypothetical protein